MGICNSTWRLETTNYYNDLGGSDVKTIPILLNECASSFFNGDFDLRIRLLALSDAEWDAVVLTGDVEFLHQIMIIECPKP